jgi:hypothetical protein
MRTSIGCIFLGLLLTTAVAAKADDFNFTYTSNDGIVTATGTLTGSLVGGVYDITSGTIDVTGGPVTGDGTLIGNPNFPGTATLHNFDGQGQDYIYDDALMPGLNPQLDGDGLVFAVDDTGINLWGDGVDTYSAFSNWGSLNDTGDFSATLAPTPEPSSLILLGTGFLGVVGVIRRRLA